MCVFGMLCIEGACVCVQCVSICATAVSRWNAETLRVGIPGVNGCTMIL